jgi:LacI family transcriptional regulator
LPLGEAGRINTLENDTTPRRMPNQPIATPPDGLAEPNTTRTPHVLVILETGGGWSRGILRGFMAAAHERGWVLLHYHPSSDLNWLMRIWSPTVVVLGPVAPSKSLVQLAPATLVSVTVDRSADGIASVCIEEDTIAELALQHLLATGLRQMSTFRFDESPFAIARERAFIEGARAAGVKIAIGWGSGEARPMTRDEDAAAMIAWLRQLPKPCGIFTCTDGWARTVARYARAAELRIPEDLALIGADNDVLECELMAPSLSSVLIPWQEIGRQAAKLVRRAVSGSSIEGERVVVSPIAVVPRRSSDVLAIDDELVARAVRWIRANADRRITVPMVVRAIGGGRQRLERRFRRTLARTVQDEIRRAHVDRAKALLGATQVSLPEIAKRSGFTNAGLLTVAFQRELGMPPGAYRRRVRQELATAAGEHGP